MPEHPSTRFSLRYKITVLIVGTAAILGAIATAISLTLYFDAINERYVNLCTGTAKMMAGIVPGDTVNLYLDGGVETASYQSVEHELVKLQKSFPELTYLYVYQIREDGCHVVFDLDTPELTGGALGDVVPHEENFVPYRQALLNGEPIEPVVSKGAYGWLLTVYEPIYDSGGVCRAYAGVDISMQEMRAERYVFAIRMISLLVGATILIIAIALWYVQRHVVSPINALSDEASRFAFNAGGTRDDTAQELEDLHIATGDEIENLYDSITKMVKDVSSYIALISAQSREVAEKAETIQHMQDNIILAFANMIENRDACTGDHVRHTAAYVDAVARALRAQGRYTDILTDDYVNRLPRSAPLHDVGKIAISDTILNKPGRLTAGEFEAIKAHTVVGRDILRGSISNIESGAYLQQAIDMATYHHERWDGTGYPDRLAGDAIPLSARIMAVADVFDALVSRRSYKEPYSFEEAVEIIREESGTHFDPAVVAAFLSIQPQIKAIAEDAEAEA